MKRKTLTSLPCADGGSDYSGSEANGSRMVRSCKAGAKLTASGVGSVWVCVRPPLIVVEEEEERRFWFWFWFWLRILIFSAACGCVSVRLTEQGWRGCACAVGDCCGRRRERCGRRRREEILILILIRDFDSFGCEPLSPCVQEVRVVLVTGFTGFKFCHTF